jgi:hypothetical protein
MRDVDTASVMCEVFYSESGGDWSSDPVRINAIKHNNFQRKINIHNKFTAESNIFSE